MQDEFFVNRAEFTSLGPLGSWKHPIASFFHLAFKAGAILVYLFSDGLFENGFVLTFILTTLLLAADFWTTKNISGRLLVGLRWWNEVGEDGSEKWVFEAADDDSAIDPKESRLFWAALFLAPILWAVFGVVAIFSLQPKWILIIAVALSLSFSNIWGYIKCAKDAKERLATFANQYIGNAAMNAAIQRF
jgi:hypothetical protein